MAADDIKARIRAVAMELFTAQGYERTSLREIADRVGMTKAALYYHYPSKQALLVAVIQPLVDEWRRDVEAAAQEPYNPASVRDALGRLVDTMVRHRDACAIVMRDTPALASVEPVLQEMMHVTSLLHTWLAGPHPTDVDRIKAVAASEVLGDGVASALTIAGASPVTIRQTIVDCLMTMLDVGHDRPSKPPRDWKATVPAA